MNRHNPPSERLFNRGLLMVSGAQFFSALADNALFFLLLELLYQESAASYSKYLLQAVFISFYLLLAPLVGLLADHQPKGRVLLWGNGVKLLGMALLFFQINPYLAYGIVGFGAALYSPAKFGILSELVTERHLVRANSLVEGSTIVAILLGTYFGGLLAANNLPLATLFPLTIYGIALLFNYAIPKLPPLREEPLPFKTLFPNFKERMKELFKDREARFAIFGTSLFWGAAATLRLLLDDWVRQNLSNSIEMVSLLNAVVGIGIVIGSLLAALFIRLSQIHHALYAGILMGLFTTLFALQSSTTLTIILLIGIGLLGGLFMIPLNALLQARGQAFQSTGQAVAVQNFAENLVMLLMMAIFGGLSAFSLPPQWLMATFGLLFVGAILLLARSLKRERSIK